MILLLVTPSAVAFLVVLGKMIDEALFAEVRKTSLSLEKHLTSSDNAQCERELVYNLPRLLKAIVAESNFPQFPNCS